MLNVNSTNGSKMDCGKRTNAIKNGGTNASENGRTTPSKNGGTLRKAIGPIRISKSETIEHWVMQHGAKNILNEIKNI